MNLRIFGISDRATLEVLPDTRLSASWLEDAENRWIDVEAASQEELRELLAPLQLHAQILNACLLPQRSNRFISQQDALYLEVPTHLGWNQHEKPYVSILCLKTTIITIHRDSYHSVDEIIQGLDVGAPLYARSSSALLHYLLVQINRSNVDAVLVARNQAARMDHECHDCPENLDRHQVATLRRKMSHYSAVHDDHTYCAGVLQTVESEAFRASEQANHFQDLLRLTELGTQLIVGAESRVANLQRDYELTLQHRVDSRLQFLTIISAVFLPLTLISAIYGMNFNDLPPIGTPYGYLMVVGLMVGTGVATAAYFYWRGWFE